MNEIQMTTEALQGQALAETIKRLDVMYQILVGNGNPSAGLATQFALLKRDVEDIKAAQRENEKTRAAQIAELKRLLAAEHRTHTHDNERTQTQWRAFVIPFVQYLLSAALGGLVALTFVEHLSGR